LATPGNDRNHSGDYGGDYGGSDYGGGHDDHYGSVGIHDDSWLVLAADNHQKEAK